MPQYVHARGLVVPAAAGTGRVLTHSDPRLGCTAQVVTTACHALGDHAYPEADVVVILHTSSMPVQPQLMTYHAVSTWYAAVRDSCTPAA
jgi:hypothetical protein